MNLYDLTKQQSAIKDLVNEYAESNDGNISNIADQIDVWMAEFDVTGKIEAICYLIKEYSATAEAREEAAKNLAYKASADVAKVERLKAWLKYCMESSGIEKTKAGLFDVSIRTAGQASFVLDVDLLNTPTKYIKTSHSIDSASIKEAIKAGDVEASSLGHYAEKTKFVSIK